MSILKLGIYFILLTICDLFTVKDFQPGLFQSSQPSGFYNIDTGDNISGNVLAFADLNGDKYTDYIACTNKNSGIIQIYLWKQTTFVSNVVNINITNILHEVAVCKKYQNIDDFDGDSELQILITFYDGVNYFSKIFYLQCKQKCNFIQAKFDHTFLEGMSACPFPFDIYGKGQAFIFTFFNQNWWLVSYINSGLNRTLWTQFVKDSSYKPSKVTKHYASLVDVNGDCFSELVLLLPNGIIQMYIKIKDNKFNTPIRLETGKDLVFLAFQDINADGSLDLFLVSNESNMFVPYVILNQNRADSICKLYTENGFKIAQMKKIKLPNNYLLLQDSNIKFGDVDFDGLPDMIGIFSVKAFTSATILMNKGQLTFDIPTVSIGEITRITNPIQICFFDFTQNGKLDIIIVSQATKIDNTKALIRTSIMNNLIQDSFFIKILPLSYSASDQLKGSLPHAMGVTVQWIITNIDGDKTINIASQKQQWNYGSCQLPFTTAGLGRTNNYIEDLTVGYPGFGMKYAWTPIIPNSQLICKPKNSYWLLQALLKDNSRVYYMIYFGVVCLISLGIFVIFLNWKQNQEDKKDHYNFIQMIR